jgi:hypothetical protein
MYANFTNFCMGLDAQSDENSELFWRLIEEWRSVEGQGQPCWDALHTVTRGLLSDDEAKVKSSQRLTVPLATSQVGKRGSQCHIFGTPAPVFLAR